MKNHYHTLGVPENASDLDIKLAYRKLAKRYHPDVNAGAKGAEERFKEISEAYNTLSDFSLRQAYDAKRSGRSRFSGSTPFYNTDPKAEKKDPRHKEYSEEDLDRARRRHKKKIIAQKERRRKILRGMIVTFILYLCASAGFEYWLEQKRKTESDQLAIRLSQLNNKNVKEKRTTIDEMDSPFDSLFGAGIYVDNSPNHFVIRIPFSDAVICAVQNSPPFKTIRNEFVHATSSFRMNELPDGSYWIKMYTGQNWDVNKKIPDGRMLGGFTKNEKFYRVNVTPYHLQSSLKKNSDTNTCDTIILNPSNIRLDSISRMEFFNIGEK